MTAVMPTSKNGAPQFSAFSKILQTTRLPPGEDNWRQKSADCGLGSEQGAGNSDEIRKGRLRAATLMTDGKRNDSHRKAPWKQTIPDGSLSHVFSTRRNPYAPGESPFPLHLARM